MTRVLPRHRVVTEVYEPAVWGPLMAEVRPGDTVADVGAFVGLYTVALARRVGASGRVLAFEPDPGNFVDLTSHIRLNYRAQRVELHEAAVGDTDGRVAFVSQHDLQSHIVASTTSSDNSLGGQGAGSGTVACVRLDTVLAGRNLDILKVDVEGYEEHVLRGGSELLQDARRAPRVIFIEVHPYAWDGLGVSGESLLALLHSHGYHATDIEGQMVTHIESYGEIIARRSNAQADGVSDS